MSETSTPDWPEGDSGLVEAPRIPILWHSNAPWVGTGYGTQTALFAPLINERLNYRVAFSAFFGLKGSRIGWVSATGAPYIIYPAARDAYGNDVVGAHMKHWFKGESGMVILLTDPWVMNEKIMSRIPTLAWTPIDHDPIIPQTLQWFVRSNAMPLSMSHFGEERMREAGLNPFYVPHGYDPSIFHPEEDRRAARASLRIPQDAFLVTMVAANRGVPSRKGFPEALRAFKAFQDNHPEAVLYLHTKMEEFDGEPLHSLCKAVGVRPMTADQYGLSLGAPPRLVARLMGCSDVLLNPAYGEGFGVPLIEAQACGTPCVVTDFSAMPEVAPAAAGNWNVEGDPIWTPFESWQSKPRVDGIVAALEEAYSDTAKKRQARRDGVLKHAEGYQAEHVLSTFWEPVLQNAMQELDWRRSTLERF